MSDEHQERSQTQKPARKKLTRRDDRDHSQPLRFTVQILFAVLNVWIGVQFYLWVRWAESGGRAFEVSRPAGVEGWLPIEGLMQLKYFLVTGKVPHVHAAGFFLFTSFLVISFVFRKAFCSWICPVGTVSEYLWKVGRSIFGRNLHLPRWADIPLRSLKYLVLSFFAYAVIGMSAASIAEFLNSPYALIVDVRMLNFFRYIGGTAAWVVLGLVIASIFVPNFWCRYLCPYGGFLGLVSLLSPVRRRRHARGRRPDPRKDCLHCKDCCDKISLDNMLLDLDAFDGWQNTRQESDHSVPPDQLSDPWPLKGNIRGESTLDISLPANPLRYASTIATFSSRHTLSPSSLRCQKRPPTPALDAEIRLQLPAERRATDRRRA